MKLASAFRVPPSHFSLPAAASLRLNTPMSASSPPLRRLAFVVNRAKPGAAALAADLAKIARAQKVKVALTDKFPIPAGFLKNQDACCVLGGDGTILSVVGEAV